MLNHNGEEDMSFDTVWFSKGNLDDSGYIIEIAIPFKSLRFPYKKEFIIGLGVRRSIGRKSETVTLPEYDPHKGSRLSQRQMIAVSDINYDRLFEIIPALTLKQGSSYVGREWQESVRLNDFSLTGKIGITPEFILDVTYNPDFSQVESDAGQIDINLRYALFYAEKRPFFLEGQDYFAFACTEPGNASFMMPFKNVVNTRSIVDPLIGLKLIGKVGDNNRLLTLFALDEYPKKMSEADGKNFEKNAVISIFRYKRGLYKDSYFGGFYTWRQLSGSSNRLIGSDGRFRLTGKSKIEYYAFASFSHDVKTKTQRLGSAFALEYSYLSRKINLNIGFHEISKDFRTDIGYIIRTGISKIPLTLEYTVYPDSKFFQRIKLVHMSRFSIDKYSNLFETVNWLGFEIHMPRQGMMWMGFYPGHNEIYANQRFQKYKFAMGVSGQIFKQVYFDFNTIRGKKVYYDLEKPFQGKGSTAWLNLIFQPSRKLNIGVRFTYDSFYRDSDDEKIYDYTIIRNKTTYQLNRYLFFRGIVEYNSYHERINADFLASFTYIPGTVIQAGYGSIYEKMWRDGQEYFPVDDYIQIYKAFFFKASYLWRF